MKKILSLLSVLALSCAGLHAQSTNSFVVVPSAPIMIAPPVPAVAAIPAVTTSSLTVSRILIDPVKQTMTIWFVGLQKPIVISGAAFTQFQTTFQGQFGTAIAAYLQANPPTH